jgi:hypothetical protein
MKLDKKHSRFEELLGLLIDGELTDKEQAELNQLIKETPSRLEEIKAQLELSELMALTEDELKSSKQFLISLQTRIEDDPFVDGVRSSIHSGKPLVKNTAQLPWAVAASALFALLVTVILLLQPQQPLVIAALAEVEGSFQWINDNGRINRSLKEGQRLTGGTLESLAPDGMAKVRFEDGTLVQVWGETSLSIAANPKKVLHLRYGNAWVFAKPQPEDFPLVMHTPEADLQVVGTIFKVLAEDSMTNLLVKEGLVRLTRITDGAQVEVPAAHRVLTSSENVEVLTVKPQSRPVVFWKSHLPKDVSGGRWVSEMHALRQEVRAAAEKGEMTEEEARRILESRATDLLEENGRLYAKRVKRDPATRKGLTYMASLSVLLSQTGPIVLVDGARFVVRGEVQAPTGIMVGFCGLESGQPRGGRYYVRKEVSGKFELEVPISEFQFWGKSLNRSTPVGKELVQWWCSTDSQEAALMITGLELQAREN